jgi:phosphate transport system substrate-binding protein
MMRTAAAYDGSEEAIAYTGFYYADHMYENPDVKLLSVDGTAPSVKSIQSGKYPLTNEFYIVLRSDEPSGSPARQLRDWLLSRDGSLFMANLGYIPLK